MVDREYRAKPVPLVIHASAGAAGHDVVKCEEVCLRLASDGSQMVLSRYFELYRPGRTVSSERAYTVPLARLLDWMMQEGERHFESSAVRQAAG